MSNVTNEISLCTLPAKNQDFNIISTFKFFSDRRYSDCLTLSEIALLVCGLVLFIELCIVSPDMHVVGRTLKSFRRDLHQSSTMASIIDHSTDKTYIS